MDNLAKSIREQAKGVDPTPFKPSARDKAIGAALWPTYEALVTDRASALSKSASMDPLSYRKTVRPFYDIKGTFLMLIVEDEEPQKLKPDDLFIRFELRNSTDFLRLIPVVHARLKTKVLAWIVEQPQGYSAGTLKMTSGDSYITASLTRELDMVASKMDVAEGMKKPTGFDRPDVTKYMEKTFVIDEKKGPSAKIKRNQHGIMVLELEGVGAIAFSTALPDLSI